MNDLKLDLSVIIPCFNATRTLAATIASAVEQMDVRSEIVVVDDGSTDGSLAVARSFEPKIRVLTGVNRGVSAARNRGIDASSSAWIVFLDSDDLLVAGTLRQRLDLAEKTGADVILCDWQEISDGSEATKAAAKSANMAALRDDPEIACATCFWAPPAALMYRRTLVEKIGGFRNDLPIIQDARFLFDAAYAGARFVRSPHIGARYRIHAQSLSRRNPARFSQDLVTNGKQIEALWRSRGPLSSRHQEVIAGMFNFAARGLFDAEHPEYFEAIENLRRQGNPMPLRAAVAAPLVKALGLGRARRIFRLFGR